MSETKWGLAAIQKDGKDVAVALLPGGNLVSIDVLPEGIAPIEVVRRWNEFGPVLKQWDPASGSKLEAAPLVAPLRYPSKFICVGVNFADHRQEMDAERDDEGDLGEVFMFLKPPTTAIVGPGADVLIRSAADLIDWEAEIGIIIGKGGRFIAKEEAMDHIAGYTLVNDISARGPFHQEHPCHPAVEWDWFAQKAQDTHGPIGPAVVPAWQVENPDNIPFSLTVNGVEEQSGNTKDLVHDIRTMVAAASQYVTLEPGDIIASGTCGGVGVAKGRFMGDGDEVIVTSPVLGTLKNTIREMKDPKYKPGKSGSTSWVSDRKK